MIYYKNESLKEAHNQQKNKLLYWLCIAVISCYSTIVFASSPEETRVQQQSGIKITGTIYDENKEPMPYVTVRVKGKSIVSVSNDKGEYSVNASLKDVLTFEYISYVKLEKEVTGPLMDVNMVPDEKSLSEVVVIGYQTQNRKMVTSAISSVTAKDLEMIPAASVDQMMQGMVPGLNVQNFSGVPGGKPIMMIRGNTSITSPSQYNSLDAYSSPLIVLDGMPMSDDELKSISTNGESNFLASINPNDIESMDILKDAAAAAIYGSRGANGVIIIKTKKGRTGSPKISFQGTYSYQAKPELIETVTGATERRWKLNSLYNYGDYEKWRDQIPQILTDSLNPAFNNANNWQDMFYRSGSAQDYRLSVSGGSDAVNYRVSAGYYDNKAVIINTGYDRFSFNSNLMFKMNENIELTSVTSASRTSQLLGKADEYGNVGRRGGFGMSPIDMPASYYYLSETDYDALMSPNEYQRADQAAHNLYSTLDLRARFLKDFTYNVYGIYGYNNDKFDFASPDYLNPKTEKATAVSKYGENEKYVINQNLTWSKIFNEKHTVVLFAGQEFEHRKTQSSYLGGYGVPNNHIQVVQGIPSDQLFDYYTNAYTYSKLSFPFHFNYDFKQKYLFDVFFRADASSRFGKDNRWGYFPSGSVAWRITQENFMVDQKWANEIKLRVSYGIVGDEGTIGDYARYNAYAAGNANYSGSGAITYGGSSPVYPSFGTLTSNNLKWQQKKSWNLGLDFDLFNYRLSGQINLYHDLTERQMMDVWAPQSSGYSTLKDNTAGMLNQGVDLSITAHILPSTSKLRWKSTFNFMYNDNRIASLPNNNRDLYFSRWTGQYYQTIYYIVGKPVNMFYGMIVDGVINSDADFLVNPYTGAKGSTKWGNQQLGSPKWRDVTGDNYISDAQGIDDRSFFGNPNPKFTGGWINNFRYKDWGLTLQANYTIGRDIMNLTMQRRLYNLFFSGNPNDLATRALPDLEKLNYWKTPGDQATWPAMNVWGKPSYNFLPGQSIYLEDGSFIKLKYVTLSYTFRNNPILKKIGVSKLDVWGNVSDVWKWQKATIPDAELVDAQGNDMGDGYPIPRQYTIGLTVEF